MFGIHCKPTPDSFRDLIMASAADRRSTKIDLLIGVYRDENGHTPVMSAVKFAAERILNHENSKSYISMTGREEFTGALMDLVLGDELARARAVGMQTVGGAGALRVLCDLVKRSRPDATVWLSDPGYAGHYVIACSAGLRVRRFPYYDSVTGKVNVDGMFASLRAAEKGDVVVVDASCQNPSGLDLGPEAWAELGRICQSRGLIPLVDVAYQGLARGLDADVAGIAALAEAVDNVLVAVSCSKTFGVYRERAGAAILIGPNRHQMGPALQLMAEIGFGSYGVPPDHGAAIVQTILMDDHLRAMWQTELAGMRRRIRKMRHEFANLLSSTFAASNFGHVRAGNGLFAMLPLADSQMQRLRHEHAIYGLDNGRINLTCMRSTQLATLALAIRDVSQTPRYAKRA